MRYAVAFLLIFIFLTGCSSFQTAEIVEIGNQSSLDDFYGKPSIILFGGTYCSHCQQSVPVFKEKVYDVYADKIHIWINVIDGGKFAIDDIPQGLNINLDFNQITGTKCQYIPSWVVLNEGGKVILSSCGNEKNLDDMIDTIKKLIN